MTPNPLNMTNLQDIWNESRGRFTRPGREAINEASVTDWVEKGLQLTADPAFWEELIRSGVEQIQERVAGTHYLR